MTKELFLLATLDGLSYAALLFLVALGMTLIFGVMHILNMAHGSMYAFGGYAAASLGLWAAAAGVAPGWSFALLLIAAIGLGTLLGALM